MDVTAQKLAILLSRVGPCLRSGKDRHGKVLPEKQEPLLRLFGVTPHTIWQWLRKGVTEPPSQGAETSNLQKFCAAVATSFDVTVEPEWLKSEQIAVHDFAKRIGLPIVDADYALADYLFNSKDQTLAGGLMEVVGAIDHQSRGSRFDGLYWLRRKRYRDAPNFSMVGLLMIHKQVVHRASKRGASYVEMIVPTLRNVATLRHRFGKSENTQPYAEYSGIMVQRNRWNYFMMRCMFEKIDDLAFMITSLPSPENKTMQGLYMSAYIEGMDDPDVREVSIVWECEDVSDAKIAECLTRCHPSSTWHRRHFPDFPPADERAPD